MNYNIKSIRQTEKIVKILSKTAKTENFMKKHLVTLNV